MASKRILIVGGVAGGASCAARLRRLDEEAEILIYERSANVSFANCGLPYYVGGVIPNRQQLLVATPERFRAMFNIDVRVEHEVLRIDRKQRTVEVKNLRTNSTSTESYDALVLSTGAAPIRPPLPGIDLPSIFTLRNMEDVDRIHQAVVDKQAKKAVVVGGGYIGLEMVENLRHRGLDVTVLELLDQVMPPMDPEMVVPAHDLLVRSGVDLRLSTAASSFEQDPDGPVTVVARDGQRFEADMVILAIGVKPDTRLAKDAGLQLGEHGGIRVGEQMRSSDPAIWAVGDAVEVRDCVTGQWSVIPLAGPANRQGRVAADVICGRDSKFRGTQGSAVVGLFDLTLAMTGASEKVLKAAGIPFQKTYTFRPDHAGYYPGAKMISMKLLYDPETGRLFGAQAVGEAGVEKRIDVIAMAIQKEGTVYDLEEAELCYAPQYGSAKDPVNIAGFVAGNHLRGEVDVVHWEDWLKRSEAGGDASMLLDVRPPTAPGSVPGAINIPLTELRSRLEELPRDREIWVHCGVGMTSYFACRILTQHGFKAKNLSGGISMYKLMSGK